MVGDRVGSPVGELDGTSLGRAEGQLVGYTVGLAVGHVVGRAEGAGVGTGLGLAQTPNASRQMPLAQSLPKVHAAPASFRNSLNCWPHRPFVCLTVPP